MERKLMVYISMSLDGYLATEEDDISWLNIVEKEGEDYGYSDFVSSVDIYIVGRKTYDVVLGLTGGVFSQAEQFNCYVITRENRKSVDGITFYNGDLFELIHKLKQTPGKNIYCDGGGQIVKSLMNGDLIDEYIIAVVPVLLGSGKRLFIGDTPTINLKLVSSQRYESGLVQLHYIRR